MALLFDQPEDILEDVLMEEADRLIVRKWLIKWNKDGQYDYSWEPYEAICHLSIFEEYEKAKKLGTLPPNKSDQIVIKQYTEEQYQQLLKQQQQQYNTHNGSWGYYNENINKKHKNNINKTLNYTSDSDKDNDDDEDYDFFA
eukprot:105681_1